MAKKTLITVNSAYREAKTGFLTVDGVYRKIKKGFISAGGVWKEFLGGVDVAAMNISFSGNMIDHKVVTMGNGKQYRLLELTSSGTLTLEGEVNADVWVCNGGANGQTAYKGSNQYYYGGKGGNGGNFRKTTAALPKSLAVVIASAGGTTSVAGISFSSWVAGSKGGSGANCYFTGPTGGAGGAKAGGDTRPFSDNFFTKYPCAGGGGGSVRYGGMNGDGGGGGSSTGAGSKGVADGDTFRGGAGGVTGGGAGGGYANNAIQNTGCNATYYGSGGGGGFAIDNPNFYEGGAGYQGACFIRIPLEQAA